MSASVSVHVCLRVHVSVSLFRCFAVSLSLCLSVSLPLCLSASLPLCLSASLPVSLPVSLHVAVCSYRTEHLVCFSVFTFRLVMRGALLGALDDPLRPYDPLRHCARRYAVYSFVRSLHGVSGTTHTSVHNSPQRNPWSFYSTSMPPTRASTPIGHRCR